MTGPQERPAGDAMDEPRRILHVIGRLDGYGGARMLRYLAASQAAAGCRTSVAAFTADDRIVCELEGGGAAVHVLGSRWPVDPLAFAKLARLRRTISAHVVHAWDVASLAQTVLGGRLPDERVLLATLDGSQSEKRGKRWSARAVQSLRGRVSRFFAADDVAHAWLKQLGVIEQRLQTIPPGVPAPQVGGRSRQQIRAALSLPEDSQVIAVAGPLTRQKKVDDAIWCFELVRVLHENARLLIFGDGPDRQRLERFADEVSDPGCVRFLGYRGDFMELSPAADVFWQLDASRAVPWTLLESQAAGVPVIASDVMSHHAVITHEQTGLLVSLGVRAEVARATDRILVKPQFGRELADAAAACVITEWALDTALQSYNQLY